MLTSTGCHKCSVFSPSVVERLADRVLQSLLRFFTTAILLGSLAVPGHAIEFGLYGGSFSDVTTAQWYHGGNGFHNVQTYWGPSFPTVNSYVGLIDQITTSMATHANGEMKLLVDIRGAYSTLGTGPTVTQASWSGAQQYALQDWGVNTSRASDLLTQVAALPHADLIEGFYVTDESLGR